MEAVEKDEKTGSSSSKKKKVVEIKGSTVSLKQRVEELHHAPGLVSSTGLGCLFAQILLITNDKENKRKAIEEGLSVETVESYIRSLGQPNLLDMVALPTSEDVSMADLEDLRPSKRKVIYSEHKPMSEITSGLLRGIYHQGKLRVNRYNPFEAYVRSESIGHEIVIYGRTNMNRAFDGDIVAVEISTTFFFFQEEESSGDQGLGCLSEAESRRAPPRTGPRRQHHREGLLLIR